MRHLPFEPLQRCVFLRIGPCTFDSDNGLGDLGWGKHSALNKAWYRAKREGAMTFKAADQFACSLGLHPSEIWGQSWYQRQQGGD